MINRFQILMSPEERARYEEAARRMGYKKLSPFVRHTLEEAYREIFGDENHKHDEAR